MKPGRKPGTTKTGGRTKDTPNRATVEIRAAATELVDDPIYRAKLLRDFRKRKVTPQVECLMWAYAYGKPIERVAVGAAGDFDKMTEAELVAYIMSKAPRVWGKDTPADTVPRAGDAERPLPVARRVEYGPANT
jgi:hypothetical protein